VGIVQTPQHFVNPDPIQANLLVADSWPRAALLLRCCHCPRKTAGERLFAGGTSSVLRAKALYGIGRISHDVGDRGLSRYTEHAEERATGPFISMNACQQPQAVIAAEGPMLLRKIWMKPRHSGCAG
jgi:hypothetical protein